MPKWSFIKEKHDRIEPIIYVIFVFELDSECRIIKNQNTKVIK